MGRLIAILVGLVLCAGPAAASGVRITTNRVPALWYTNGMPAEAALLSWQQYAPETVSGRLPRLVLISGWTCGAGWLDPLARSIAAAGKAEVWLVNRRWTAWENRELFHGRVDALNRTNREAGAAALQRFFGRPLEFARWSLAPLARFGLVEAAHDLYQVTALAGADGRPVFVGGWSDGVEFVMTMLLLRPADRQLRGHRLVKGAVLLDENPEWGVWTHSRQQQALQTALAGSGGAVVERRLPAVTVFSAAARLTNRFASPAPLFPLLPFRGWQWQPDALLGWLYDGGGYRSRWGWLFNSGRLQVQSGRKIAWLPGEVTPVDRIRALHRSPGYCWEWFYPRRVAADYWMLGVTGMRWRGIAPDIKCRIPLLAVYSSFNRFYGRIPAGLRWFMARTGIQSSRVTILRDDRFGHGDLLLSPLARPLHDRIAGWISGTNCPAK